MYDKTVMSRLITMMIVLLSLLTTVPVGGKGQKFSERLYNQLSKGDTGDMYKNLSEIVYIQLEGEKGAYSKKQAKAVLDKFFNYNKPKSFKLLFDRYKEENSLKYSIGKLSTIKGNFRVYLLIKVEGDQYLIKQIRLEKL